MNNFIDFTFNNYQFSGYLGQWLKVPTTYEKHEIFCYKQKLKRDVYLYPNCKDNTYLYPFYGYPLATWIMLVSPMATNLGKLYFSTYGRFSQETYFPKED